jgi:ABC-2 type transport system ATP-binding protein
MADKSVIQVESVSKRFGHIWAVRDLTLEIPQGEIFCLLGPSGSGKTTTIRMMLGIYLPDSGTLSIFGRPVKGIDRALHYRFGYMPQFFVLHPTLTVQENLNFVAMLYGVGWGRRRRRIRELLGFLELEPVRKTVTSHISGGQRRRLALAAALIHEPELLFLDEPTAGIDPILRSKLWKEFRRLNESGTTLIVTTQYVLEAEYADQVAILSSGELAALGTPHELRQRAVGFTGELMHALRRCPCMRKAESPAYDRLRLTVTESATALPEVMTILQEHNVEVKTAESVVPAFEEAFVRLVEQYHSES